MILSDKMAKLIYDGENAIFGRVSAVVAKELLKGNYVSLINCEKLLVSGDPKKFAEKILKKRRMGRGGSMKGPKYIRQEDKLVKRMIRGMLPWDRSKGREAFKRLRCYIGNGGLEEKDLKDVKKFNHQIPQKTSTIKQIVGLIK